MNYLELLLLFVFAFSIVMLIYIFFINRGRKEYKEGKKITEIEFLVKKYNLDMRKVKYNKLKWTVTIVNSFIVASTSTIISVIDSPVWQILVGFIILFALIFAIYEIIGRLFARKGSKNNE